MRENVEGLRCCEPCLSDRHANCRGIPCECLRCERWHESHAPAAGSEGERCAAHPDETWIAGVGCLSCYAREA
jgi:hypothetical protein